MSPAKKQQQQDTSGSDLGRFADDPALSSVNADKFKEQMENGDEQVEGTIIETENADRPTTQDTTDKESSR